MKLTLGKALYDCSVQAKEPCGRPTTRLCDLGATCPRGGQSVSLASHKVALCDDHDRMFAAGDLADLKDAYASCYSCGRPYEIIKAG